MGLFGLTDEQIGAYETQGKQFIGGLITSAINTQGLAPGTTLPVAGSTTTAAALQAAQTKKYIMLGALGLIAVYMLKSKGMGRV